MSCKPKCCLDCAASYSFQAVFVGDFGVVIPSDDKPTKFCKISAEHQNFSAEYIS